jgi:glycosyltransferase involved in cell wall biosynthesis
MRIIKSDPIRVIRSEDLHSQRAVRRPTRPRGVAPQVSLIIPTLNEAANIDWVLDRVPIVVTEILVVDGRSTDDTVQRALEHDERVVVVLEQRHGKGAALLAGFAAATGDIMVAIDADGSMDPAETELFVAALMRGYDFVKGSRIAVGGDSDDFSVTRRIGSAMLTWAANRIYGLRWSDMCYGYFAFWADVLPELDMSWERLTSRDLAIEVGEISSTPGRRGNGDGHVWTVPYGDGFEIEAALFLRCVRAGKMMAEIPSVELMRLNGASNLHPVRDGWRVLNAVVRERARRRARNFPEPVGRSSFVVSGQEDRPENAA